MSKIDQTKEVTIRDIVLTIRSFIIYYLRNLVKAVPIIILVLIYFLYSHIQHKPEYEADLDFLVEGQTSSASGLGGLLGTFGISKPANLNSSKVLEVARSRKLLVDLLSDAKVDGRNIGDVIIEDYDLRKGWSMHDDQLLNYVMPDSIEENSTNSFVVRELRKIIWGSSKSKRVPLVSIDLDEASGLYNIRSKSKNELLSIVLCKEVYMRTKQVFEDEMFSYQRQTTQILKSKSDSLKMEIDTRLSRLAELQDRSAGLVRNTAKIAMSKLSREITALNVAYSEVTKSYELNDVSIRDQRPTFMALNEPYGPLEPTRSSLLRSIIFGLALGGLLSFLLLSSLRWYKSVVDGEDDIA